MMDAMLRALARREDKAVARRASKLGVDLTNTLLAIPFDGTSLLAVRADRIVLTTPDNKPGEAITFASIREVTRTQTGTVPVLICHDNADHPLPQRLSTIDADHLHYLLVGMLAGRNQTP